MHCLLYNQCNCKTAICRIREPDATCPIYKYFYTLIKDNLNSQENYDILYTGKKYEVEI